MRALAQAAPRLAGDSVPDPGVQRPAPPPTARPTPGRAPRCRRHAGASLLLEAQGLGHPDDLVVLVELERLLDVLAIDDRHPRGHLEERTPTDPGDRSVRADASIERVQAAAVDRDQLARTCTGADHGLGQDRATLDDRVVRPPSPRRPVPVAREFGIHQARVNAPYRWIGRRLRHHRRRDGQRQHRHQQPCEDRPASLAFRHGAPQRVSTPGV